MTPNWEDPSVGRWQPDLATDRYSLGLVFLRVFGAAHFPIQGRQNEGDSSPSISRSPEGLRGSDAFGRRSAIWDLCGRSLSVRHPEDRPSAGEWVAVLEDLLAVMGASGCSRPGSGKTRTAPPPSSSRRAGRETGRWWPRRGRAVAPLDVIVRPVAALPRLVTLPAIAVTGPVAAGSPAPARSGPAMVTGSLRRRASGLRSRSPGSAGAAGGGRPGRRGSASDPRPQQLRRHLRRGAVLWLRAHRQMLRQLTSRGRRGRGFRRLLFLVLLDFIGACVALFIFGVFISPFLGL